MPEGGYGLFEVTGVELEYMIVDRRSLAVSPVADRVLGAVAPGEIEAEIEFGPIAWSNELVLHVIELKTNGPADSFDGLAAKFQENVRRVQEVLEPLGARLLPTGMHPWMNPLTEAKLWPHEYGPVYRTFDRIFGCRGPGWGNLQSTHVNLPFDGDEEFGRLHAAIRVLLPVIPALSASSPIVDGRVSRWLDARMEVYRSNARQIPSVMGVVIPERVFSRSEYDGLLESIYADLAPHDPEGVLRHPWVNARGCIARFDRGSVEIRVIDSQECALADVAVSAAVTGAVRALTEERLSSSAEQRSWSEHELASIFREVLETADGTVLRDERYLRCLGYPEPPPCTAADVWRHLVTESFPAAASDELLPAIETIVSRGSLAKRILGAIGGAPRPDEAVSAGRLREVYGELGNCLAEGRMFTP